MIAIIDYGAGNIGSVYKALKYIDCESFITNDKSKILKADGVILPGVGSFGDTIGSIDKLNLRDTVVEFIKSGKPFLGICLGLQMLFPASEESPGVKGLNLLNGSITKIPSGIGLKIPHIGWNSIDIKISDGLFKGITKKPYVYFVHSYFLKAENRNIVSAHTKYGVTIDAAIQKDNVMATQFHPEKSGDVGLKMLKNFANMQK